MGFSSTSNTWLTRSARIWTISKKWLLKWEGAHPLQAFTLSFIYELVGCILLRDMFYGDKRAMLSSAVFLSFIQHRAHAKFIKFKEIALFPTSKDKSLQYLQQNECPLTWRAGTDAIRSLLPSPLRLKRVCLPCRSAKWSLPLPLRDFYAQLTG